MKLKINYLIAKLCFLKSYVFDCSDLHKKKHVRNNGFFTVVFPGVSVMKICFPGEKKILWTIQFLKLLSLIGGQVSNINSIKSILGHIVSARITDSLVTR